MLNLLYFRVDESSGTKEEVYIYVYSLVDKKKAFEREINIVEKQPSSNCFNMFSFSPATLV